MGAPSSNIAQFWNLGTERYECLKTGEIDAFIDIESEDKTYIASLQYGKSMKWVHTCTFRSKSKKAAVLKAFDQLVSWIANNKKLMNDVSCPDILRPYKIKVDNVIKEENIDNSATHKNDSVPIQLSLF